MIDFFIFLALLLRADLALVDRLVAFAPDHLDEARARDHVAAACLAADRHRVDCSVLLAIAYNESRYAPLADGAEASGLRACGLMGVSRVACDHGPSPIASGYLAGAAALRGWIDEAERPRHPITAACRRRSSAWQCAMMGYAGGWRAIDICNTRGHANCGYPDVVLRRARRIRGRDVPPY